MTLTLLTHYLPTERENYQQLADLILPERKAYCERHGYQHFVQKGVYHNPAWYYAFTRLQLLRDLLDQPGSTDLYWVLNLQSVITNHVQPVTSFLDSEHDCWLTKDVHGINLGSFIVRNTAWTRTWLDFLIAQEPVYRHAPWHEQKAVMDWWLHERWTWMIHLLPQRAINAFDYSLYHPWPPHTPGQWRPGDLVLSLPGLNLQQRLDMVGSPAMAARIIR